MFRSLTPLTSCPNYPLRRTSPRGNQVYSLILSLNSIKSLFNGLSLPTLVLRHLSNPHSIRSTTYISRLLPTMIAVYPSLLICICYRLDQHLHSLRREKQTQLALKLLHETLQLPNPEAQAFRAAFKETFRENFPESSPENSADAMPDQTQQPGLLGGAGGGDEGATRPTWKEFTEQVKVQIAKEEKWWERIDVYFWSGYVPMLLSPGILRWWIRTSGPGVEGDARWRAVRGLKEMLRLDAGAFGMAVPGLAVGSFTHRCGPVVFPVY